MKIAPGDKSVNMSRNLLENSLNLLSQSFSPQAPHPRKEKDLGSTRQIILKTNHAKSKKLLEG